MSGAFIVLLPALVFVSFLPRKKEKQNINHHLEILVLQQSSQVASDTILTWVEFIASNYSY